MEKNAASVIVGALLFMSMLALASNAQLANSSSEVLFFDDFNDGVADGWIPQLGPWSVVDGRYFVTVGLVENGISTVDGLNLADCVIETKLRFTDTVGFEGGIVFRYTDNQNYYAFEISNEYDQAHVLVYTPANPDYGQAPSGGLHYVNYPISENIDYDLKVEVRGNTFDCFLNGQKVISSSDESYSQGLLGFRARRADVLFDDFTVSSVEPIQPSPPFTDEFNTSTLDSRWTTVDPDAGSSFDLTTNPGWLRIATTSPPWRDLYGPVGTNAPRVLQPRVNGNFTIETKVLATADEEFESGGILVWKDSTNFIRLDRACGMSNSQRIVFIAAKAGEWIPADVILPSNLNPTYLKLVRLGDSFSGYYSGDGINWNHVGEITFPIGDTVDVGLLLVNVYHSGTFSADFDYFRVSTTIIPQRLTIELSGNFDYSAKENIKIRLGAMIKEASTMELVSDANVTIKIYYPNGTLWISDKMVERSTERGFYDWQSSRTIYQMKLPDGVYSVYANASVGNGPIASDFILFHIDPPAEESASPFAIWLYYAAIAGLLSIGAIAGAFLLRQHRKPQKTLP